MGMKTVNLEHFAFFSEGQSLERLNAQLRAPASLMPHQVAASTGCSLTDAMAVLLLLADTCAATPLLLVYHKAHPDGPPILARSIVEGLPSCPLVCDHCEEEIDDPDELWYDFLFKLTEKVQFVLGSGDV